MKRILVNADRSYLYTLKETLGILDIRLDIIEPYIKSCEHGTAKTSQVEIICIPYKSYCSWVGFHVDECFYVDDKSKALFRKNQDKDIFQGTVIDYIVKIEIEEEQARLDHRRHIIEQFAMDGYGDDICEMATNICIDYNISYTAVKTLLKTVEKGTTNWIMRR